MRDGILSDESVMKMCAEFQPIPLGQVSSILNVKQIEPKLPTKSFLAPCPTRWQSRWIPPTQHQCATTSISSM